MTKRRYIIFLAAAIFGIWWPTVSTAEEIAIGYMGPLSGLSEEFGQDCLNGLEMAINEINASGGLTIQGKRYTIKLIKKNVWGAPQISFNTAQEMLKESKVIAIFTPDWMAIGPLQKINQEANSEFIIVSPSAPDTPNKLTIITIGPFTVNMKAMAEKAWDKGWRKGAIVIVKAPYGELWRKTFRMIWEGKGGSINVDETANYFSRTDFSAPLTKALASNPDFLLIGGPSSTTALVIEQARARGFEGGFVIADMAKLDAIRAVLTKPLGMEGSIGIVATSIALTPDFDGFLTRYKNRYPRSITWEVVNHYTSMYVLAKAISFAGTTTDVRSIRTAFPKVLPIIDNQLPWAIHGITPSGRFLSPTVIQDIKYGKFGQPSAYVWWPKSQKEFDKIKRASNSTMPIFWLPP